MSCVNWKSRQTYAADWLWLHARARAAFLAWRSPRDGAPAAAIVLRIWCRAGSARGAAASAPDSGVQALADGACGIRTQSNATASAPHSGIQVLADGACSGQSSAASCGAQGVGAGGACGQSSADAAGLACAAACGPAVAGSERVSDSESFGCMATDAAPGLEHERGRPWAMELAAAAAALTHLGPARRCALAASSSMVLLVLCLCGLSGGSAGRVATAGACPSLHWDPNGQRLDSNKPLEQTLSEGQYNVWFDGFLSHAGPRRSACLRRPAWARARSRRACAPACTPCWSPSASPRWRPDSRSGPRTPLRPLVHNPARVLPPASPPPAPAPLSGPRCPRSGAMRQE